MWVSDLTKRYDLEYSDFCGFLFRDNRILARNMPRNGSTDIQVSGISEGDLLSYYYEYLKDNNRQDLLKRLSGYQIIAADASKAAEKTVQMLRQREDAARQKREDMTKMLISSGFSFEGYRITRYSGYISGDDATQIPRSGIFGSDNGQHLTDALVKIRIQALKELKEAAYELGCNAVIGVDFDYLTLEPETRAITGGTLYEPYVICVTANGNAVVVEKIED